MGACTSGPELEASVVMGDSGERASERDHLTAGQAFWGRSSRAHRGVEKCGAQRVLAVLYSGTLTCRAVWLSEHAPEGPGAVGGFDDASRREGNANPPRIESPH